MQRIVFLESESIIAELRQPAFAHDWVSYPKTTPDQVVERLAEATIAVINKAPLPAAAVNALPKLKMVAVAATGTNVIDLEACRARGIVVANVCGYAEHTVPEHVMALLLALSRNVIAYRQAVADGDWQRSDQFCCFAYPISDLHGATLAIIGSGSLGDGVARLAEAFGMHVLRSERKGAARVRPGYTPFAEALRTADAVSLHCPLTAETENLIGESELRAMKSTALLINTARGGLVDEAALVLALQQGWIAGAGFDVLTVEPPSAGNLLLAPELLGLANFLLTPHVAWASRPAMQALADQLVDNLEAFARDAPENRVA